MTGMVRRDPQVMESLRQEWVFLIFCKTLKCWCTPVHKRKGWRCYQTSQETKKRLFLENAESPSRLSAQAEQMSGSLAICYCFSLLKKNPTHPFSRKLKYLSSRLTVIWALTQTERLLPVILVLCLVLQIRSEACGYKINGDFILFIPYSETSSVASFPTRKTRRSTNTSGLVAGGGLLEFGSNLNITFTALQVESQLQLNHSFIQSKYSRHLWWEGENKLRLEGGKAWEL